MSEVWNEHDNELGDWCPHSGEPIAGDPDDGCPAGCPSSAESTGE